MQTMASRRLKMMMMEALMVAAVFHTSAAKTIKVGGTAGWGLKTDYAQWASTQIFAIGDTLVFDFSMGTHDVALVTKKEYDACDTAAAFTTSMTEPPVSVKINNTDPLYFVCTVPGHCTSGMKLAVTVGGGSDGSARPLDPTPHNAAKKGHDSPPSPSPASPPSPAAADVMSPSPAAADTMPPSPAAADEAPAGSTTGKAAAKDAAPSSESASTESATPPSPAKGSAPSLTATAGFSATVVSVAAAVGMLY